MNKELFDYITRVQPTPAELSKTPQSVKNYIKLLEKAIIAEINDNVNMSYVYKIEDE